MKNLGNYYGATLIDTTDLVDTSNKNRIILEYYKNKKHSLKKVKLKTSYGIKVVKKEYKEDKVKLESNTIKQISTNEAKIKNIIKVLKTYKVTPIALNDVLTDLLKTSEFQEN